MENQCTLLALSCLQSIMGKGGGTRSPDAIEDSKHYKLRTTNKEYLSRIKRWCLVNEGPSKTANVTTFHWCPHHVRPRLWDGMYSTHTEEHYRGKKTGSNTISMWWTTRKRALWPIPCNLLGVALIKSEKRWLFHDWILSEVRSILWIYNIFEK